MEEKLNDSKIIIEKLLKSLKDVCFNDKLFNTEVISAIYPDGNFAHFCTAFLELSNLYFSSSWGSINLYDDDTSYKSSQIVDEVNWILAMLYFLKEKKLLKEFKEFYTLKEL